MEWVAKWTGEYPRLCYGEWHLYCDAVEVGNPFGSQPADTLWLYGKWVFTDDWDESCETYVDGLSFDDWALKYRDWLVSIAPSVEWEAIYKAFQVEDWRHS